MESSEVMILKHLENWDCVGAQEEIKKEEHQLWIQENGWDKLVPVIVTYLSQEKWEQCPQVVLACEDMLSHIAKVGKPKEVLISLAEHCEAFQDDIKYRHILPAIGVAFTKLGISSGAAKLWDWILDTLVSHLLAVQVLEPPVLEGKERLTLDGDENLVSICQTVQVFVELLIRMSELIKEGDVATNCEDFEKSCHKCKGLIVRSSMQVLSRPLAFLHLDVENRHLAPSTSRAIAEDVVGLIEQQVGDPLQLVSYELFFKNFGLGKPDEKDIAGKIRWCRALGVLFFLIEDTPKYQSFIPMCYSPLHVFNTLAGIINLTLADDESYLPHLQVLVLSRSLLSNIQKSSLSGEVLELETHIGFLKALYKAIVYHASAEARTLAFTNLQKYVELYSPKGRYQVAKFIFMFYKHSGLIGYIVTQLKNVILDGLNNKNLPDEYRNQNLAAMISQFCRLKHGEKTDILEVSDELMASLNFLIGILIRDKKNETGIRDVVQDLEKNFLIQIEKGITLSRTHNELQLKNVQDPNLDEMQYVETTFTVGGRVLPIANREQMIQVLKCAVNTLDMISCVLAQLREVIRKTEVAS